MIEHEYDWLAERARSGNPTADVYNLDESYPGERADLLRELRTALAGCPDVQADAFAATMQAAVTLNALPILRTVVSLWRGAYRDLLDQLSLPPVASVASVAPEANVLLSAEEQARLAALRRRLKRR